MTNKANSVISTFGSKEERAVSICLGVCNARMHLQSFICFVLWIQMHICTGLSDSLCSYFINGGSCQQSCVHEAVHIWKINLCSHASQLNNKCCIPDDHPIIQRRRFSSDISTTTSTTTTTNSIDSIPQIPQCGRTRPRIRRVVGGRQAPIGAWPWQVAIRLYTGQYLCGGVIIGSRWILTAAHCFQAPIDSPQYVRAYVGDNTLSYGLEGRERTKAIRRIIKHEGFRPNIQTTLIHQGSGAQTTIRRHFHDIALIELEKDLIFNERIQPACLSAAENNDMEASSDNCWVSGWGENSNNNISYNTELNEVRGHLIKHEQCSQRWGTNFADDIVCFGSAGRGPCKGDSGGGMTCRNNDGRFYLVGIISWGREDCVHDNYPSVMSNVSHYRTWIQRHTSQNMHT